MTLFFHLVGLFSSAGYQVRDGSAQGVAAGWVRRAGVAGRGVKLSTGCPPPGVAQFPGESRAVRQRRDVTPSHTLDSQFDHHHADRARSGLGDAVLLPLMPRACSACRLDTAAMDEFFVIITISTGDAVATLAVEKNVLKLLSGLKLLINFCVNILTHCYREGKIVR